MMQVAGILICACTAIQVLGVPTPRYAGSDDPPEIG